VAEALTDIAYRFISKKLMAAKLVSGQKISVHQLATECGISRTPVQEAVRRLTDEGILYQIPSSGTYVARIDRRQLIDAYEVRMVIECSALEHAIRHLTKETRQELRRLCDEMHAIVVKLRSKKQKLLEGVPLVKFLSDDLSFHLVLMSAAGNRLAIKIVTNAFQRNQFFGLHSHRRDLLHLAWVWRHHAKIERAIRRGDLEGAQRWLRAHIARSMADALAAFDQAAAAHTETGDPVDAALERLSSRFA
jgi:DNA-binding GntR family transcriptional regulator